MQRLMPTCASNIVEPHILTFQRRYTDVLNYRKHLVVNPDRYPEQERMLAEVWQLGRLGSDASDMKAAAQHEITQRRHPGGWRRIGLDVTQSEEAESESAEREMFKDVEELGLECLVSDVRRKWDKLTASTGLSLAKKRFAM